MTKRLTNDDMRDNKANVYHTKRIEQWNQRNPDNFYNLTQVCRRAEYSNIRIFYVPEYSDKVKAMQGIHLLNPSERELNDAIDVAERDGFERIFIHQEF